jgi:hypothetical protein
MSCLSVCPSSVTNLFMLDEKDLSHTLSISIHTNHQIIISDALDQVGGGGSRGSSGSIVSDYELDDGGSIPGRGKGFFF